MGTPPSSKTTAQRLQEALDAGAQLRADNERLVGVEAENMQLKVELVELRQSDDRDTIAKYLVQIRNLQERLILMGNERDKLDRRMIEMSRAMRRQNDTLTDIRELVTGKKCLLPQIVALLG